MKMFDDLGKLVVTKSINERMNEDKSFRTFIFLSLGRYKRRDWGDLDEEDKESNNYALKNGDRVFAAYIFAKTKEKIWIITERDRSVTTILFPDEY